MCRVRVRPVLLVLIVLSTGCENAPTPEPTFTVWDSAGIEIVESSAPLLGPDAWTVSEEPVLMIGGQAARPQYDFWFITRILRLSNGQVLVANSGTREIRWYHRDGRFLFSIGGEGEGPGEFRWIHDVLLLPGDTLLVLDRELDRLTTFGPSGTLSGTFTLPRLENFLWMTLGGSLSEEKLLWFGLRGFLTGQTSRVVKDSVPYLVSDRNGLNWDTLGWFPDSDQYVVSTPRFVSMEAVPFRRQASRTVYGGQFYTGMGEPYEIDVYSHNGGLVRVIRRTLPTRPLTQDQIDNDWLPPDEEAPFREARLEARGAFKYPSTIPFFTKLMADSEGNLWVRRLMWPGTEVDLWDVFDTSGRLLTSVRAPLGLEIHAIGEDYVLGVWKDDLDVEHVRMYSLDRGR